MTDFRSLLQRGDQSNSAITIADLKRWNLSPSLPWLEQVGSSKVVECTGCSEGCVMPIQQNPYAGLVVVCDKDQDLGVVPVDAADTQQWQLNTSLFAGTLAAAFNTTALELATNRLWYVGTHSGQKLVLFHGGSWPDAAEFLKQQQFKLQEAVLITLSDVPARLSRLTISLLGFATVSTDGSILVDSNALAILLPPVNIKNAQHRFLRKGDFWQVLFDGKEAYVKHSVGMTYIATLLNAPNQPIHALQLQQVTNASTSDLALNYDGELQAVDHQPQKIIDDKSIQALKNKLDDLEEMGAASEQIAAAKEALLDAASDQKSTFKDEGNKAQDVVRKAIIRARSNIQKHLPECANHLETNIKTGFEFCYAPVKKIHWE